MDKKVTIADIARLAGTSKTTVSRVINGNGYVSEETRNNILKIIDETKFIPSSAARTLASHTSKLIGVVVPEIENEFFTSVLKGISAAADESGYILLYFDTNNDFLKERKALIELRSLDLLGLIITPTSDYGRPEDDEQNREYHAILRNLNIPVVEMDRSVKDTEWDGVFFENYKAAYAATKILADQGYGNIATITGDLNIQIGRERFRGYEDALRDAGLAVRNEFIFKGDFSVDTAYRIGMKMLSGATIPDAVFTANNSTSMGFIRAVREMKMKLGREIAMIGIDQIKALDNIGYNYSYIARDCAEMGRIAMRMLDERINKKKTSRNMVYIPYRVELKGSERNERFALNRGNDSQAKAVVIEKHIQKEASE